MVFETFFGTEVDLMTGTGTLILVSLAYMFVQLCKYFDVLTVRTRFGNGFVDMVATQFRNGF